VQKCLPEIVLVAKFTKSFQDHWHWRRLSEAKSQHLQIYSIIQDCNRFGE